MRTVKLVVKLQLSVVKLETVGGACKNEVCKVVRDSLSTSGR